MFNEAVFISKIYCSNHTIGLTNEAVRRGKIVTPIKWSWALCHFAMRFCEQNKNPKCSWSHCALLFECTLTEATNLKLNAPGRRAVYYFCANEPEIAKNHAAKRRNRQLRAKLRSRFFSLFESCAETTKNRPREAADLIGYVATCGRRNVKWMKRGKSQPRRKEILPASSVGMWKRKRGCGARWWHEFKRVGRQELGCRNCKTVEKVDEASHDNYLLQHEMRLRDNTNFFSNEFCIQCAFEDECCASCEKKFFPVTNSCTTRAL